MQKYSIFATNADAASAPVAYALQQMGDKPLLSGGYRDWRTDGNDFVSAGLSIWPDQNLVCHVARRIAAQNCSRTFAGLRRRTGQPGLPARLSGFPPGLVDIGEAADLSNIGTLFAFVLVSLGVLFLRKAQPDRPRGFKVPWVPLFPIISVVLCVSLMAGLLVITWLRFFGWLAIGMVIYWLLQPPPQRVCAS